MDRQRLAEYALDRAVAAAASEPRDIVKTAQEYFDWLTGVIPQPDASVRAA